MLNSKHILVTGGAGYIGSHFVHLLESLRIPYVVLDSLARSRGHFVPRSHLMVGDICDEQLLRSICRDYDVDVAVHFAAFAYVGESVVNPSLYYENNVLKSHAMVDALLASNVRRIVFSSSCATYGNVDRAMITEDTPQLPVNPYGETKLAIERMLSHYDAPYGLRSMCLRYFNAAGLDENARLFEDHDPETHLIPLAIRAIDPSQPLTIFGRDYPTPDGTCIRDYVHVNDLATAHLSAVENLRKGSASYALNLGTEKGYSVREVVESVSRCSGQKVHTIDGMRRPGDPPVLVANAARSRSVLGWTPQYQSIDAIIATALLGRQRSRELNAREEV